MPHLSVFKLLCISIQHISYGELCHKCQGNFVIFVHGCVIKMITVFFFFLCCCFHPRMKLCYLISLGFLIATAFSVVAQDFEVDEEEDADEGVIEDEEAKEPVVLKERVIVFYYFFFFQDCGHYFA